MSPSSLDQSFFDSRSRLVKSFAVVPRSRPNFSLLSVQCPYCQKRHLLLRCSRSVLSETLIELSLSSSISDRWTGARRARGRYSYGQICRRCHGGRRADQVRERSSYWTASDRDHVKRGRVRREILVSSPGTPRNVSMVSRSLRPSCPCCADSFVPVVGETLCDQIISLGTVQR